MWGIILKRGEKGDFWGLFLEKKVDVIEKQHKKVIKIDKIGVFSFYILYSFVYI